MSEKTNEKMSTCSSGCMIWGLFLASLALNALLLTGCISPYEKTLRELAGEQSKGLNNPFSSPSEADRLKSVIEKRFHSGVADCEEKIKRASYVKGRDEGLKEGQLIAERKCTDRLSAIAQTNVDVGAEDAFEKTLAGVKQKIETLEKGQGEDATRPRRLMRDIADKLGVSVNKNMGINDLHSRIVGAVEEETKVPHLMSDDEIKAALKEITWKKELGEYHEFVKRLSGKRIIILPPSSGNDASK